jgi:hypothetical protein
LEGKLITVTDTNLIGLEQLCEEFGFSELSVKLSNFKSRSESSQGRPLGSWFAGIQNPHLRESFQFIVKGTEIESDFAESSALFPTAREQPSVDSCARKFFVTDSRIEASDILSLELLLSGETISAGGSVRLLSNILGNVNLERLFLNCSKGKIRMNLSELMIENRIDLESADVSILSVEALDSLLLSESISVESEDSLLRFILKLGPNYRDLLRHFGQAQSISGIYLLYNSYQSDSVAISR